MTSEDARPLAVTIVVGNPKPASRTLRIATDLVARLLRGAPADGVDLATIDLAEHTGEIFTWPSDAIAALTARVAASDLVVLASPTYKGAYTGLLKAFLDRYPADGLAGVVAIPVMTGADLRHALAPDTSLRPLLVELGASVPTRSLYYVVPELDRLDERLEEWVGVNAPLLRGVARIAAAVDGSGTDGSGRDGSGDVR